VDSGAERVGIASFHLVGDAQLWYGQYKNVYGPPPWHQFSEVVNTQFGPHLPQAHGGLVVTFDKQFNALLSCAPLLPAAQQVLTYTTNLQEPLTVDVEVCQPTSLLEATSLCALVNAEQTGHPRLQNQP
jgi:hypothetical protein